jgi:hypothetical protein
MGRGGVGTRQIEINRRLNCYREKARESYPGRRNEYDIYFT